MKLDPEEQKAGAQWFWGAGAFALLLSLFLAFLDYHFSHSKSEQELGQTLRELRSAQGSLASRASDPRQVGELWKENLPQKEK